MSFDMSCKAGRCRSLVRSNSDRITQIFLFVNNFFKFFFKFKLVDDFNLCSLEQRMLCYHHSFYLASNFFKKVKIHFSEITCKAEKAGFEPARRC